MEPLGYLRTRAQYVGRTYFNVEENVTMAHTQSMNKVFHRLRQKQI